MFKVIFTHTRTRTRTCTRTVTLGLLACQESERGASRLPDSLQLALRYWLIHTHKNIGSHQNYPSTTLSVHYTELYQHRVGASVALMLRDALLAADRSGAVTVIGKNRRPLKFSVSSSHATIESHIIPQSHHRGHRNPTPQPVCSQPFCTRR